MFELDKENKDLEGRLVLIASDSNASRKLVNDLFRQFSQDHVMGSRVLRLNTEWLAYSNGEENFRLVDPHGILTPAEIDTLLRNSDTYFVTKLENPFLANPLKYLLDPLIDKFGRAYTTFRLTAVDNEGNPDENSFKRRFLSYVASNLPLELEGVVKKKVLDEKILTIAENIKDIFDYNRAAVINIFKDANHKIEVDLADKSLTHLKNELRGYLSSDVIQTRSKQRFIDELKAMSYRIGRKVLRDGDKGRFNWITPWLDGRSDHNKVDPNECVRLEELADYADFCNVSRIFAIRMHSKRGIDFFEKRERPIYIENLTQTNEYISLMGQDPNIAFERLIMVSPDMGGIYDAMVSARELYRRTGGRYTGRVVVFDKKRVKAGEIAKMELLASYMYNPEKDPYFKQQQEAADFKPYDILCADTFKDPNHSDYIKNFFDIEHKIEEGMSEAEKQKIELELKKKIDGYDAFIRDDICGSGRTMIRAGRETNTRFNCKIMGGIEHPSFTGDAIAEFDQMYKEGILKFIMTSTSIVHPHSRGRVWHIPRSMTDRIKSHVKRHFMPWLEENVNDVYARLNEYSINKR